MTHLYLKMKYSITAIKQTSGINAFLRVVITQKYIENSYIKILFTIFNFNILRSVVLHSPHIYLFQMVVLYIELLLLCLNMTTLHYLLSSTFGTGLTLHNRFFPFSDQNENCIQLKFNLTNTALLKQST